MLDVMIDLETMGTQPDAAIVAIGAVEFDAESGALGGVRYLPVDLASSVATGGTVDPATVVWWTQQDEAVRRELWSTDCQPLTAALAALRVWLQWRENDRNVRIWGNGAAFDNVVLRGAYQRIGEPPPWQWRNDRCFRTLRKLLSWVEPPVRTGVPHIALDDALHQARHAIALLQAVAPKLQPVGAGDGQTYVKG